MSSQSASHMTHAPTGWDRMTRTLAHYERIEQIGEGTYGQVYRAKCLDSGRIVAMKKIRVHHGGYWGMPPTVLREIKILKRLRHPHLVEMLEVVSSKGVEYLDENDPPPEEKGSKRNSSKKDRVVDAREGYKGNIYLVLEYVSHDLTGLMDVAYRFTEVQVKSIFRQLLEALEYMHDNKYVHRDIKSSNILIDSHFRVKLADFGLARCIEPPILDTFTDRGGQQELTNKVITLWYRPPEILLGATRYGFPVDVWSAGCILAELLLGKPLLTGKTEMDQLQLIFDLLGTPTAETWEGLNDLKLLRTGEVAIDKHRKPRLRDRYGSKLPVPALNLLEKLLELDPKKRLTANRALTSRYFLSEPRAPDNPAELGMLQLGGGGGHFHEFQTKKKRREAKTVAKKASEDARTLGLSEKEAEAEYDAVYRECMKKVAEEGNAALGTVPSRKIDGAAPRPMEASQDGVARAKDVLRKDQSSDIKEQDMPGDRRQDGRDRANHKDPAARSHGKDPSSQKRQRMDQTDDRNHSHREEWDVNGVGAVEPSEDRSSKKQKLEKSKNDTYEEGRGASSRDQLSSRQLESSPRASAPRQLESSPQERSSRHLESSPRERSKHKERHRTSSHRDHGRDPSRHHERERRDSRRERDGGQHLHRKSDRERHASSRERERSKRSDGREREGRSRRREEGSQHDAPVEEPFRRDYHRGGAAPHDPARRPPQVQRHDYPEPSHGRFMPPEPPGYRNGRGQRGGPSRRRSRHNDQPPRR